MQEQSESINQYFTEYLSLAVNCTTMNNTLSVRYKIVSGKDNKIVNVVSDSRETKDNSCHEMPKLLIT